MVSKIEAAEALAEAVERHRSFCEDDGIGSVAVSFNTLQEAWKAVGAALATYRSASVPSDEELGRVAYATTGLTAQYEWNDLTDVQRRKWSEAAAAVREWVQRDSGVKLTDDEREWLCEVVTNQINRTEEDAKRKGSILRKLGHEPEPVWEWDSVNSMWTLGGKVGSQVFPCASVMLSSGGLIARVYLSEMNATSVTVDGFKEACEWCEQKIREARQ